MAAGGEAATVFLETSLGTRLVVSFPASTTTVADLKRQVTAEHAACFPQTGPIAVKSLQVKHDGSLFHLTDSMAVEGAFRWIKGHWNLLVEVHELRSHPLARKDADCGSCDSEQNAGNPVVRDSTQNMSSPAVSEGDGDLAIGDGVSDTPLLNQLDEPHEGIQRASDQLEDSNTVPQESSDIYLAAAGGDTPPHEGVEVEHALGQQKDGIVKTILQECPDLYLDAGGSDNPDKLCEGVKHASGQPEDGNVKTMLPENSDLNLVAGESDPRAKNQLDKSHEDIKHAVSLCKDGNIKIMLQGISSLDVAAGEGETPSMNQQDKSYEDVKHTSGQHKNENVKTMVQESSDLDVAAGEGVTPSMNPQNQYQEDVKHALGQHKNGNVKAMFQDNSGLDVAAGEGETPPKNQLDKSYESIEHASRQCEDGNVKTMPEESSDFDVAASESETPSMNQLDKSREDVRYASGQLVDGIVNIMLQKSSDLDESAAAKDLPMRDQQKDVVAEPRGTELFRKEDKNDESVVGNCGDNISSIASSTVNINLAQEKSSRIEQENLNSNPLAYNQGSCSHGMGKTPSHDQKEPWTSGESSNSGSDIPPCVQSMDRDNSSNRKVNAHRGNEEEPWVVGLCPGESSSKETDVPHCIKSMKEGNKRPASNDRFLKKRKYDGTTSTISTEQESCFITRQQRVLSVRKMPMSKAAKIYGFRC